MSKIVPSRGSDQFVVRFPEGMRDALKKVAEANGRSMNAEILARLDETFTDVSENEIILATIKGSIAATITMIEMEKEEGYQHFSEDFCEGAKRTVMTIVEALQGKFNGSVDYETFVANFDPTIDDLR